MILIFGYLISMIFTNLKWMMMIIIIIIKIIIIIVKVKSRMLSRMKNKYKMKKLDHLTPLTQLKDTLKQDSIESPKHEKI